MSEPIWNGHLNPERDLARADGQQTPLSNAEVNKIVKEIVAGQRGTLIANQGVQSLAKELRDLKASVSAEQRAVLQTVVDKLDSIAGTFQTAGESVERALSQLQAAPTTDFTALVAALADNSNRATEAVNTMSAELLRLSREKDELYAEFDSTDEFRRCLTDALRNRRLFGRILDVPHGEEDQLLYGDSERVGA